MDRTGQAITYEDVARAVGELRTSGSRITILSIRERLGRGSFSTVKKHLARLESEQGQRTETAVPAQLESLWNEARRAAEAAVEADREELQALGAELDSRLALMQSSVDDAIAARLQADIRLADRSAELERSLIQIEVLREQVALAEHRGAALEAELAVERESARQRLQEVLSGLTDLQNAMTQLQASQTATSDLVSASARSVVTSVSELALAGNEARATSLELLRRDLKAALYPLASVPSSIGRIERLVQRISRVLLGSGKRLRLSSAFRARPGVVTRVSD